MKCECGCDKEANIGCRFINGHNKGFLGMHQTSIVKNRIGVATRKHCQDPEYHDMLCIRMSEIANNPECKMKKSVASKILWQNPEYREKQYVATHTDEYGKQCSNRAKALWLTPEWAEMQMTKILEGNQSVRPNKPETKILEILKSLTSDIKYVGDGSHWILGTGKNPDFVDENKKQIIEVFGCYWHGCAKHFPDKKKQRRNISRINEFKNLGYLVLVIWECELKYLNKVTDRIQKFSEV